MPHSEQDSSHPNPKNPRTAPANTLPPEALDNYGLRACIQPQVLQLQAAHAKHGPSDPPSRMSDGASPRQCIDRAIELLLAREQNRQKRNTIL